MPRYAPVEPEQVQVLLAEPMQGHDRLGEIVLDISVDPPAPVADVEHRLREEGAEDGRQRGFVVRDVANPERGRKLIGVAVRYQPMRILFPGVPVRGVRRRGARRRHKRRTSPGRGR